MSAPTAVEAFAVWREDAELLTADAIPDAQVPIIGLVAVYAASGEQKTVHDFSQHINADSLTAKTLARLLPEFQREEFNDLSPIPLWSVEPQNGAPARTWTEYTAIHDGVQPEQRIISERDYFLGRMIGQAICNYAVTIKPLNVNMPVAGPVLTEFFPHSLTYTMESR